MQADEIKILGIMIHYMYIFRNLIFFDVVRFIHDSELRFSVYHPNIRVEEACLTILI